LSKDVQGKVVGRLGRSQTLLKVIKLEEYQKNLEILVEERTQTRDVIMRRLVKAGIVLILFEL
jgi:hypothetical protein